MHKYDKTYKRHYGLNKHHNTSCKNRVVQNKLSFFCCSNSVLGLVILTNLNHCKILKYTFVIRLNIRLRTNTCVISIIHWKFCWTRWKVKYSGLFCATLQNSSVFVILTYSKLFQLCICVGKILWNSPTPDITEKSYSLTVIFILKNYLFVLKTQNMTTDKQF